MPTSRTPTARLERAESEAWLGLVRLTATVRDRLDGELTRRHNLSLSAYDALASLAQADGSRMRMAELARDVMLSPSRITRLVESLADDGLVDRVRCPADARSVWAELLPAGRRRLEEARPTHVTALRESFLGHLDGAELDELVAFWERMLPESCLRGS